MRDVKVYPTFSCRINCQAWRDISRRTRKSISRTQIIDAEHCKSIKAPGDESGRGGLGTKNKNFANMAVTMYAFLEAILLLVNAVAVLNEERFLAKSKFCYSKVQSLAYFVLFVYIRPFKVGENARD